MHVQVEEERDLHPGAPGVALQRREYEQRQPGQQGQEQQATLQVLEMVPGQMGSTKELVKWPSQDQGEFRESDILD
ncbi:MAG: hypothetical protein AMXMBFR33_44640 [Candidatus Xenobia bacterium]